MYFFCLYKQWTKKHIMSKVARSNMQEIYKLGERKNVSLSVVQRRIIYYTKRNITDVMQMGTIKSSNQDADLISISHCCINPQRMLGVGNRPSRHNILISAKLLIQDKMKLRMLHQHHYIHHSISKAARFLIGTYLKQKISELLCTNSWLVSKADYFSQRFYLSSHIM